MKSIIGVTSNVKDEKLLTTGLDNIKAVLGEQGIPMVLPNILDKQAIHEIAVNIDGVLVTGGGDIDPTLFGEEPHPNLGSICPERDEFEFNLIKEMLQLDKPVLAICRGCQIMNIAVGGDMYQDIYSQISSELLQHYQKAPRNHASHFVELKEGTLFKKLMNDSKLKVNSFHHQAVRELGDDFQVSAVSSDGIIEAYESTKHKFAMGIQWHPENFYPKGNMYAKKLFKAFIHACNK